MSGLSEQATNLKETNQSRDENESHEFSSARTGAAFSATHWSVVAKAANDPSTLGALETLCGKYWYPIYAFIRRRGADHHQAEDLTQAFFTHLLAKELITRADRTKGKFRTFLLAALTNFLANEWDKQQAIKRGGRHQIVSLDETVAEDRYREEPAASLTPEKLFERQWALALLGQALARLNQEHVTAGKAALFKTLEPVLTGAPEPGWYARAAAGLNLTENALRVALHRLRHRFGEIVRDEIAPTAGGPAETEEELRYLLAALAG